MVDLSGTLEEQLASLKVGLFRKCGSSALRILSPVYNNSYDSEKENALC